MFRDAQPCVRVPAFLRTCLRVCTSKSVYRGWPSRALTRWKQVESGVITFANGDKYEGDWSEGAKNGKGKYTCKNGVCYDGKWKDDQRHGSGVCAYGNGDVYEGRWFKNHKHGQGTYKFHNGNVYTGDWRCVCMCVCVCV